jgi:hypothetical protein
MVNTQELIFQWVEPLPADCPPTDAWVPDGESYYRLVSSIPPTERDFYSQRRLWPAKMFSQSECTARACSLLAMIKACARIRKFPTHKYLNERIVRLTLTRDSGLVTRTRGRGHHSWWWAKGFDPVANCEEVIEESLG